MNKMINKKAEEYTSPIMNEVFELTSDDEAQKIRNRMLLAVKIDEAIESKGWTKKKLAEKLNKQPSVITKWVSGTHNFTSDTLWDIERLLGINLIDLGNSEKEQILVYKVEIKSQNTATNFDDYNDSILIDRPTITQTFETGFDC